MKTLILSIYQWWRGLFITPGEAQECAAALRQMHTDVHAAVDALETPEQVFARWRREGLIN